jgi:hypothetical protein
MYVCMYECMYVCMYVCMCFGVFFFFRYSCQYLFILYVYMMYAYVLDLYSFVCAYICMHVFW